MLDFFMCDCICTPISAYFSNQSISSEEWRYFNEGCIFKRYDKTWKSFQPQIFSFFLLSNALSIFSFKGYASCQLNYLNQECSVCGAYCCGNRHINSIGDSCGHGQRTRQSSTCTQASVARAWLYHGRLFGWESHWQIHNGWGCQRLNIFTYYGLEVDKNPMKQENVVCRAGCVLFVKRSKLILDRCNKLDGWHEWDCMIVGIQLCLCTPCWSIVIPLVIKREEIGLWKLVYFVLGMTILCASLLVRQCVRE